MPSEGVMSRILHCAVLFAMSMSLASPALAGRFFTAEPFLVTFPSEHVVLGDQGPP